MYYLLSNILFINISFIHFQVPIYLSKKSGSLITSKVSNGST